MVSKNCKFDTLFKQILGSKNCTLDSEGFKLRLYEQIMYIITTISSPFNPKFLKGRFFFYYHFFINCAKTHCPCYTNFFHYLTYRFAKTRIKQTIWTFFVLQFALLSFFLSSVTIRLKLIIIDESSDDSVTEILQKGHRQVALSS